MICTSILYWNIRVFYFCGVNLKWSCSYFCYSESIIDKDYYKYEQSINILKIDEKCISKLNE